ncbi:antibiotic biosynthesis monooxygenase [Streptomyces sp. NPDC048290]|uniref:antibiotic biosynthesis monooxygenase family protein n=1 Tax=Streptomyces sp. NPDC048290 TaxID=3155811 RepID=UPI00343EFF13
MNDHSPVPAAAPLTPIGVFEPPYHIVVFSTVRTERQDGYAETNARMEELVKEIPGFLGLDHAQTPGGLGITVGYFRDADAIARWRSDDEHRAAQRRGMSEWYERYTVQVAKVERSQEFQRR